MKKILIYALAAALLLVFFSFRLTKVPSGITVDEAAFGYNGVLLSRTLHDENGRLLPMFVLSIHGQDWRQPVTQYFTAAMFKTFGPSVFNLRMTAVIIAVASIFLIYFLAKKLLGSIGAVTAAIVLATTPVIMIQSHLGLDNIAPVPFVIGWLFTIFLYEKTRKNYWLILSAVCLGIGYYSYKGMRVFVPTWVVLTTIYLAWDFLKSFSKKTFSGVIKPVLIFLISIFPFFAIIPVLEFFYSGAVLGGQHPVYEGVYKLLYPYFSMFDPSFLFIKGDALLYHSTGTHGMYLLASLPLFIIGLVNSWKKGNFWKFIIIAFFIGPLLFGLFGSVHRASRMLAEVPLYALISAVGFLTLWQRKSKIIIGIIIFLFFLNYFDFIRYYLFQYAKDNENIFSCFDCAESQYKTLKSESINKNLIPYVDEVIAKNEDTTTDFARSIYFTNSPARWNGKRENLPKNAVLMTNNDKMEYLTRIGQNRNFFYYIWK